MAISPDRLTLVCSGYYKSDATHETLVWDLSQNQLKRSIRSPYPTESLNSPQVYTQVRAFSGGQHIATPFAEELAVQALSADARWLALGNIKHNVGPVRGYVIEIWDFARGRSVRRLWMEEGGHRWFFQPTADTGRRTESAALRIFATAGGEELHHFRLLERRVGPMAFSPDGRSLYLAENSRNGICGWHLPSGKPMASVAASSNSASMSLSSPPMANLSHSPRTAISSIAGMRGPESSSSRGIHCRNKSAPCTFSKQGELLVANKSGRAAWWNPNTGAKTRSLCLSDANWPLYLTVQGDMVAARYAYTKGVDWLVDAATGKRLYGDEATVAGGCPFLTMARKRRQCWAAVCACGTLPMVGISLASTSLPGTPMNSPSSMSVSADDRFFAVYTYKDRLILWDRERQAIVNSGPATAASSK